MRAVLTEIASLSKITPETPKPRNPEILKPRKSCDSLVLPLMFVTFVHNLLVGFSGVYMYRVAMDLMSESFGLFIKSSNQKANLGENRNCWVCLLLCVCV